MVWTVQGKIEPGASKFSFAIAVPPFNTKGGFQVPGFVLGDVGGSVKLVCKAVKLACRTVKSACKIDPHKKSP